MKEGIGDIKLLNELAEGHCQGKEKTDCRWFDDRTKSHDRLGLANGVFWGKKMTI